MGKKPSVILYGFLPGICLILAFLYILLIVQPVLHFHHTQPPFILDREFIGKYPAYPGGIAELAANFFLQSFHDRIAGPLVFFFMALVIMWLAYRLTDQITHDKTNIVLALIPFILTIVQANNYNFPFAAIVSLIIVLSHLLLLSGYGKNLLLSVVIFLAGAVIVYFTCGSGYLLLFTIGSLILPGTRKAAPRIIFSLIVIVTSFVVIQVAYHFVFLIPVTQKFFYLFPEKMYYMAFKPSSVFYFFLFSVPALMMYVLITGKILKGKGDSAVKRGSLLPETLAVYIIVMLAAVYGHRVTFNPDGKKNIKSDYCCYHNDVPGTLKAASGMKEYSLTANLNYNLVISRAGRLSDDFFRFFQISGTDAIHPDNEFLAERAFIATDFYYHLGYISEARHWAYEALVFYPYSVRAMKSLVKIHLVLREYTAAEKYLNLLRKGLIDKNFVKMYAPLVNDTALTRSTGEIAEKRSFMPGEHELSPFIEERFRELIGVNKSNKQAYEFLMLYYLLDSQPQKFLEWYEKAGEYFDRPVGIYEEAWLMYGHSGHFPETGLQNISTETAARFARFKSGLEKHKGNNLQAMKALYSEFGRTYMYYLQFIWPRIIKPDIIPDEDERPPI